MLRPGVVVVVLVPPRLEGELERGPPSGAPPAPPRSRRQPRL